MQKPLKIYDDYVVSVSDTGQIFHNGKALKQSLDNRSGYVNVCIRGHRRYVHRLVASAFIQPLEVGDRTVQVHHINGDKTDNRLENLKLMSMAAHLHEHKQKYPTTKRCLICGNEFTPHKTKRKRAQTCSKECAYRLITKSNREVNGKAICQYDTKGNLVKIWECGRDIERELNFYQSNIIKCCQGIIKTYKGYVWEYAGNNKIGGLNDVRKSD